MANKLKDTTPRPRIGKTAKDTRMARLIDINQVVDEVNDELTVIEGEQVIQDMRITALESSGGGGSEYTETIVNISSAQLKNLDNAVVELLPALSGNQYYDIQNIILEFNYIAPFYSAGTLAISIGDNYRVINSNLIVTSSNQVVILKDICVSSDIANRSAIGNTSNLSLNYDTNLPVNGNGTLRVKIYHKTITFGA